MSITLPAGAEMVRVSPGLTMTSPRLCVGGSAANPAEAVAAVVCASRQIWKEGIALRQLRSASPAQPSMRHALTVSRNISSQPARVLEGLEHGAADHRVPLRVGMRPVGAEIGPSELRDRQVDALADVGPVNGEHARPIALESRPLVGPVAVGVQVHAVAEPIE